MRRYKKRVVLLLLIFLIAFTNPLKAESLKKEEWKAAIESDKQALSNGAEDEIPIRFRLSVAYANIGDLKKAMTEFKALKNLDGGQKTKQIITKYSMMYKIDPKNVFVLNYLAFAYYADEQYHKSREYFQKVIRLDPENPWVLDYYALALSSLEDYDNAIEILDRSLNIDDNKYTHFVYAYVCYQNGQTLKSVWHLGKSGNAGFELLK